MRPQGAKVPVCGITQPPSLFSPSKDRSRHEVRTSVCRFLFYCLMFPLRVSVMLETDGYVGCLEHYYR